MKTILFYFLVFFTSCISEKKQRFKAEQFYKNHPQEFAQNCAEAFPVMTRFVQGMTIITHDTIIKKGIVLDCPPVFDTVKRVAYVPKVKCPDQKTIYIDKYRTDTVFQESTAKVEQYRLLSETVKSELAVSKNNEMLANKKAKERLNWLFAIGVIIAISIVYQIKK